MFHLVSPIQGDVAFVRIDSLGVAQGWIVRGLSGRTGMPNALGSGLVHRQQWTHSYPVISRHCELSGPVSATLDDLHHSTIVHVRIVSP